MREKFIVPIDPISFHAIRDRVHQEFPAWGVKSFAPQVYLSAGPATQTMSIFSITNFRVSDQDIERIKVIVQEYQKIAPPVAETDFTFTPLRQPDRRSYRRIRFGRRHT